METENSAAFVFIAICAGRRTGWVISMSIFEAAILGLVQGLCEFLPVSSSGHLLLVSNLMHISGDDAAIKVLQILLHVGTLLPLIVLFWKDWRQMIRHPIKNKLLALLLVALLPAVAIYLIAKKVVVVNGLEGFAIFDNGWFLGVSFLITSLFLLLADMVGKKRKQNTTQKISFGQAVVMGLFQAIGLLPGVSRSGSTITGGLFAGLDKRAAAKFSFMMSAPAVIGSLVLEGKDALEEGLFSQIDLVPTIVGIVVAAVCGFLALNFMMKLITKVPLGWFALYTALLGITILILQMPAVQSAVPAVTEIIPAFKIPDAATLKDVTEGVSAAVQTVLPLV